ncbi:hypothetical protein [Pontibacter saemangeumensis]|uniref:hypothetical protein n=1 Tax=Pontibacter saemangeumensis TaxID=1084525 RepID=UPI0031E93CB3
MTVSLCCSISCETSFPCFNAISLAPAESAVRRLHQACIAENSSAFYNLAQAAAPYANEEQNKRSSKFIPEFPGAAGNHSKILSVMGSHPDF